MEWLRKKKAQSPPPREVGLMCAIEEGLYATKSDKSLVLTDGLLCAMTLFALVRRWKAEPSAFASREKERRLALAYLVQRWMRRLAAGSEWEGVDFMDSRWLRTHSAVRRDREPSRNVLSVELHRGGDLACSIDAHVHVLESLRDNLHRKLATPEERLQPGFCERRRCCLDGACAKRVLSVALESLKSLREDLDGQEDEVSTASFLLSMDEEGCAPPDAKESLSGFLMTGSERANPKNTVPWSRPCSRLYEVHEVPHARGSHRIVFHAPVAPPESPPQEGEKEEGKDLALLHRMLKRREGKTAGYAVKRKRCSLSCMLGCMCKCMCLILLLLVLSFIFVFVKVYLSTRIT